MSQGVRGRNSDNALILSQLGWEPTVTLRDGLKITYFWIKKQARTCQPAAGCCNLSSMFCRSCTSRTIFHISCVFKSSCGGPIFLCAGKTTLIRRALDVRRSRPS